MMLSIVRMKYFLLLFLMVYSADSLEWHPIDQIQFKSNRIITFILQLNIFAQIFLMKYNIEFSIQSFRLFILFFKFYFKHKFQQLRHNKFSI